MPRENLGSVNTGDPTEDVYWIEFCQQLAIKYIKLVCGESPPGVTLDIFSNDHDSGSYSSIGLYSEYTVPSRYAIACENALQAFDAAVSWRELRKHYEERLFEVEDSGEALIENNNANPDTSIKYAVPTSQICNSLLAHCNAVYQVTVENSERRRAIDALGMSVNTLENFVRGYERISDPSIDTDDEILNWAFSETMTDLCGAIWLLACGFYKGSASLLRNAFDIATASLYFQIRENTNPGTRAYNRFFSEWDRGDRETPNWGEMKPFISSRPSVVRFKANTGVDILEEAYQHFRTLCSFTHSAAFTRNQEPVTAINMTGTAPAFDERYFQRGVNLTSKTISQIAIMWQVVFPQIAETNPLSHLGGNPYDALFPPPLGPLALRHQ